MAEPKDTAAERGKKLDGVDPETAEVLARVATAAGYMDAGHRCLALIVAGIGAKESIGHGLGQARYLAQRALATLSPFFSDRTVNWTCVLFSDDEVGKLIGQVCEHNIIVVGKDEAEVRERLADLLAADVSHRLKKGIDVTRDPTPVSLPPHVLTIGAPRRAPLVVETEVAAIHLEVIDADATGGGA